MSAIDKFKTTGRSRAGGPANLAAVTPSDASELEAVTQWLYIGQAGSLKVTTLAGQTVTFAQINQGWHLMELRQIHATGTTASAIMAGW